MIPTKPEGSLDAKMPKSCRKYKFSSCNKNTFKYLSRSVFPISTHPCFQSTLTFSKRLKALLSTRRGFVSSKTKPLDIQPVEHNGQLLVTDTHNLICKEPLLNPTVWELSTSDNVNVSTNRCHKPQIYYLPIMSYCSPPGGMN